MTLLRSIAMAFSLFSRIPMPHIDWKPESMRYMIAAFPLIGAVIGLIIWGWVAFCGALGANFIVLAAGVTVIPLLVTGGIHVDGFADVVDAQSSHAEPERKREILKDPHIGAFAAIGIASYLVAYFALATQISFTPAAITLVGVIHVLTRAGSGIATTAFAKSSNKGMLAMEQESAAHAPVLVTLAIVSAGCIGLALWLQPAIGAALTAVWALSLPALKRFANKEFGGMSGDLAGFYLQSTELALLATLAVAQLVA